MDEMLKVKPCNLDGPLPLAGLRISTRVRINPEFLVKPTPFAFKRGVHLVAPPVSQTEFARDVKAGQGARKVVKAATNVYLVRNGGVRLYCLREGSDDWLRSIDINPAIALYDNVDYPLQAVDLLRAQSLLLEQITPLLADADEECHLVPGIPPEEGEPLAFWSHVEIAQLFPDVDLRLISGLGHQDNRVGLAAGLTHRFARLGDKNEGLQFEFERYRSKNYPTDEPPKKLHLKVTLRLGGRPLAEAFAERGATVQVNNSMRVANLRALDIAAVYREQLSLLQGTYLPAPPQWSGEFSKSKEARTLAILSTRTPLPLEELVAMHTKIRTSSLSTLKRLKRVTRQESARIKVFPVAELFSSPVNSSPVAIPSGGAIVAVHPKIIAAYAGFAPPASLMPNIPNGAAGIAPINDTGATFVKILR